MYGLRGKGADIDVMCMLVRDWLVDEVGMMLQDREITRREG